ncbi:MAG: hypothetical protein DRP01_10955, partial [Archaeoglobales archaeon]
NRMELKFVAEKILKISDFRTKQRLFKEFLIKIKSFSKNEFYDDYSWSFKHIVRYLVSKIIS